MDYKKNDLNSLLSGDNLYKITRDKGLSKLGDSLVNLTYSIAKSISINKITGKKVTGKILSAAINNTSFRKFAGKNQDAHSLADAVESLIAYTWIKKIISIDEIVDTMVKSIKKNIELKKEEKIATLAFTDLLKKIEELLL
ncbi:MAG: ribonuclease III family protein [Candidatus Odinarchaeia archaeon]